MTVLRLCTLLLPLGAAYFLPADDLEQRFVKLAAEKRAGVFPIQFWPKWAHDGKPPDRMPYVAGTGFLLNSDGYFLTAAHVLRGMKSGDSSFNVNGEGNFQGVFWGHMNESTSSTSRLFHVVEKDEQHDVALCKFDTFKIYYGKSPLKNNGGEFSIAAFQVSKTLPPVGSFVSVIGFPLDSWFPTTQFGTLAATETVNPSLPGVPAGARKLIQVAVAGNKGNSGSPVVNVRTGDVIGVIVQAIPAELYAPENVTLPFAQSSGIMLAVPIEWISPVLERNHVATESISAVRGKLL